MRTCYSLFLVLLTSIASIAQSPTALLTPAEHLLAINAQWSHNPISGEHAVSFSNDTERITYHLEHVVALLESREVTDAQTSARRHALLRTLKSYAHAGNFPINTKHSTRTPYFIDDYGTACAVGHLIIESGNEELALRIHDEYNYDYIADIKTAGIIEWASHYGFTLAELALIQPAYAPTNQMNAVGEGVNGSVNTIKAVLDDRMYITGYFDIMDGSMPCSNGLAYIQDGEYHCVDNGPSGQIYDMIRLDNNTLMVVGYLVNNGSTYPAAVYSEGNWEYISVPERPDAIGKAVVYNYSPANRYILALDPQGIIPTNEVWGYDESGTFGSWEKLVTTSGPITCADDQNYIHFGGDFDSYSNHLTGNENVATDGLFQVNLYASNGTELTPYISDALPDDITTLLSVGEILYIGGTCDNVYPNTYLTRLQNSSFQSLIYRAEDWGQGDLGLYDIAAYTNNQLLLAGDMDMGDFGTLGNNLGTYDLLSGGLSPIAMLDAPARSLAEFNGDWYVGGDFTENIGAPVLHIATIGSTTGIIELDEISMTLSPNPASTYINISFDEPQQAIESLQVYGMDGRAHRVETRYTNQTLSIDVTALSPGVYVYTIAMDGGRASGKFVKE